MANKFFSNLVLRLLHNRISVAQDLPSSYLLSLSFSRLLMLTRGFFTCGFQRKGKHFYRGRRVSLKRKASINLGKCVTFNDFVKVDGLSMSGIQFGDYSSLGYGTIVRGSGSIAAIGKGFSLGRHSTMGEYCFVGAAGGVTIGDNVAIGQSVRFHSENHVFSDKTKLIFEQGVTHKGIHIGSNCWIGAGAVFLDGSILGNGCVVGANAVVSGVFPDDCVIAGVPAKIIRSR